MELLKKVFRKLRGSSQTGRCFLLEKMPKQAVCAEIGVWEGSFSDQIVQRTNPQKLYLIDPWEFQPEFPNRMYGGKVADKQEEMEARFEDVNERLGKKGNVEIIRSYSTEALEQLEDKSLDWVYIDGNHFYDYVKEDLIRCLSKVKEGGFITGDDYNWGGKHGYPVRRAVNEFISSEKVEVEEITKGQYILKKISAA